VHRPLAATGIRGERAWFLWDFWRSLDRGFRRATRASRFGRVLRDLGLTSNQVWGLTKTEVGWSTALESALLETRRDDLEHGTNAAYVAGCVWRDVESTSASGWPGIVAEGFLDLRQVEKAR
jgi:hypothetical protein